MQTENTPSFFEVCDFKMILLLCDLQTKDNGVYNENITLVAIQNYLHLKRMVHTYIPCRQEVKFFQENLLKCNIESEPPLQRKSEGGILYYIL